MSGKSVLAIDLGAETGRVMTVSLTDSRVSIEEVNRFANRPVRVHDTLHWNVLGLWQGIVEGIREASSLGPLSIGVDAWGVDFALIDAQGDLLGLPVHYRDARTDGAPERLFERVPRREVFEKTGIQIMQINTLYQLWALLERESPLLKVADSLLTIPDLFNYWLTGEKVCEYTNATTTQMYDPRVEDWAKPMLRRLEIPDKILPPIVQPGTQLGAFEGVPIITPACHDTGSAVAAVPAGDQNFAYISSGTWSLVGIEVEAPVINQEALAANVTNEGGVAGTVRLLKNVMGLWIVQQCRSTWLKQGHEFSYEHLVARAQEADPLRSTVPVNDDAFLAPGDHPQRIREFCRRTDQPVPETPGQVVRVVLESLALAYRDVLEKLETLSDHPIEVIHIIGGGSKNDLLNQMTADATGKLVLAGPGEATVLGNALIQFMALGELAGLGEARDLVAKSETIQSYEPSGSSGWQEAYERYKQL